ncbi:MAG: NUDIX hydrolase [Bifidobacteriaceae bacterium]|nr:NUDIX hydrolase [Bifidobacteriaceae bacterium]
MYRKFSRTISVERRSTKQKVVHEITAGGVALNSLCEAAVIQRRNLVTDELQWCLPKGHLENGETKIDAAIREIFEETGIIAKPIHKIGHFDYYFSGGNFLIHKTVHHYLMRAVGGFLTVENDPDEEAESAYYVPIKDLRSLLTYKNEKFIIDKVMREIEGRGVTAILGGES